MISFICVNWLTLFGSILITGCPLSYKILQNDNRKQQISSVYKLLKNHKQLECKIFKVFWNMSVVVFLCFFDLLGCSSKDSVSPVLVLKKTSWMFAKSRNFGHLVYNQQNYILLLPKFMIMTKGLAWKTVNTSRIFCIEFRV